MRLQRISALTLFVLLLAAATAWAAIPDRPAQDIYVQDYAGLLSQETKDRILAIGHELDEKTTAQIAVVTVKTLDDRPIADYANELFRGWGIGDKDKNNGVLLLISQDPRKLRIEVGYGLEGAMPDGWTGQVRDEQLTPYLKKDDYDTGVMKAYEVLAAKAASDAGQTLDTVSQEAREAAAESGGNSHQSTSAPGGQRTGPRTGQNRKDPRMYQKIHIGAEAGQCRLRPTDCGFL